MSGMKWPSPFSSSNSWWMAKDKQNKWNNLNLLSIVPCKAKSHHSMAKNLHFHAQIPIYDQQSSRWVSITDGNPNWFEEGRASSWTWNKLKENRSHESSDSPYSFHALVPLECGHIYIRKYPREIKDVLGSYGTMRLREASVKAYFKIILKLFKLVRVDILEHRSIERR